MRRGGGALMRGGGSEGCFRGGGTHFIGPGEDTEAAAKAVK
jgi:hypothetical protein